MNLDEAFLDALEARLKGGHMHMVNLPGGTLFLYWEPRSTQKLLKGNPTRVITIEKVFVVEEGLEVNTFSTLLEALTCFEDKKKNHAVEIALRALGLE